MKMACNQEGNGKPDYPTAASSLPKLIDSIFNEN